MDGCGERNVLGVEMERMEKWLGESCCCWHCMYDRML